MLYHHRMELEDVVFGKIIANPEKSKDEDMDMKSAYLWLEKQIGFYPLFLAVGDDEEDLRITGYHNQWRRVISTRFVGKNEKGRYIKETVLRKAGEFPNRVLFSFENLEGVFMDYDYWHIPLNECINGQDCADKRVRHWVFKYSWDKSRWLRKAKQNPGSVQFVVPSLDLTKACRVYTRNNKTKEKLEDRGFRNVRVFRLGLGED